MTHRSARAARGRRSGYSQLVYVCGSHGYGGLDGGRDDKHAGQSQVVGRMSGDAAAFTECVWNTLITPDRTTIQVRSSGYGRAGIGRSSWKGLTWDATRRFRFVVNAAVGCTPWCSTDSIAASESAKQRVPYRSIPVSGVYSWLFQTLNRMSRFYFPFSHRSI